MPETFSKEEQKKLAKLGYAVDALENEEKNIQLYDFKAPKRFTKDNLRLLNTIYDCFAKTLANKLTGILRAAVQIDTLSIEELDYSKFSKGKSKKYIIAIIEAKLKEKESYTTNNFAIVLPIKSMYVIINKLLGGSDESNDLEREFTTLELNLIRNFIVANIMPILESAWAGYIDLLTTAKDIVLVPESSNKYISPESQMLNVQFEIIIDKISQNFDICMPMELIENIFKNLGNRFMSLEDNEKLNQKKSLMLEHVKETKVEIGVILGKTELEFGDMLTLHSGDVIMLDSFIDSTAKVVIKGREWFSGKVGIYKGRKSVKLMEIL